MQLVIKNIYNSIPKFLYIEQIHLKNQKILIFKLLFFNFTFSQTLNFNQNVFYFKLAAYNNQKSEYHTLNFHKLKKNISKLIKNI